MPSLSNGCRSFLRLLWFIALCWLGRSRRGRRREKFSHHLNSLLNGQPDQTQPEYPEVNGIRFLVCLLTELKGTNEREKSSNRCTAPQRKCKKIVRIQHHVGLNHTGHISGHSEG